MPNTHAAALLAVTVVAFFLYTRAWIRMAMVSLLLMLALLVLFYLFPYAGADQTFTDTDVFEAFGHPALVAICSLMILARGLTTTGAMEPAVRVLGRVWSANRWLGLLLSLLIAGAASAFINDTPVMVLMLPLLLGLAKRTGFPASKTLLPVNFAVLAGGMLTSIGTSTNILVLEIAEDLGMRSVGLFDFTAIAAVGFAVALPYLWLVVPRLLPDNGSLQPAISRTFEARVKVLDAEGRLCGRAPGQLAAKLGRPLPIVSLIREERDIPLPQAGPLQVGDALVLRDTPEGLHEIASAFEVDLFDRKGLGEFIDPPKAREQTHLAEAVLGNASVLNGRTLREARFAEEHQVVVVGLNRGTEELIHSTVDIIDTPLSAGDVLLVQGTEERVDRLRGMPGLMLLDANRELPHSPLAPVALCIMGGVILLAATHVLPIHVSAFMGVIAMLVTGCVRLEGVGGALSLEVVLLVASSIALGQGLVATGAADWIASGVAALVFNLPLAAQVGCFMTFAALLTNFVSNSAAASVGAPIAIATANQLGAPLEPFVLAILFGANLSYATPMAYQTNILVMRAANYRFGDFVRAGLPLVIIMLLTLSYLLARRYGI
jgi:di/tricarboxylate transporter